MEFLGTESGGGAGKADWGVLLLQLCLYVDEQLTPPPQNVEKLL